MIEHGKKSRSSSRRGPTAVPVIVGLAVLVVAIMVYSTIIGSHKAERFAPLVNACLEIKLETTMAHLWLEEVVSGDQNESIDRVWRHLDQATFYAHAMLDGGENAEGRIAPVNDLEIRQEIVDVIESISAFRAIAEERSREATRSGTGSDIDQRFDAVYETFLNEAGEVELALKKVITKDWGRFRLIQALLITVCVLLTVLIGFVLRSYEQRRDDDINAIQEKEMNLAVTLDSIGDAVITTDIEGRVTGINPVAEALTGWHEKKAQGRPLDEVFRIINTETRESVENPAIKVIRDGEVVGLASDTTLLARDGTELQIADSGAPIRNREDVVTGVVLVFRDVSEDYAKDRQLRESQQYLESIVENEPECVKLVKADGTLLDMNPAGLAMIEAKFKEQVVGKSVYALIAEEDRKRYRKFNEGICGGQKGSIEFVMFGLNGKSHFMESTSAPLSFGSGDETVQLGITRDITARKQAEKERQQSDAERERLMLAIEQASETVVITDAKGTIQYANPAFERTTGYSPSEAINQNTNIIKSGKHDEAYYADMWHTLTRGETWTGQLINKRKDETLFTENATISPVRDASGAIVNYVAVKRDITEEIKLTNQLRQAQKMEAVGNLAGGMAHDFNNLLQVISGFTEVALDELEDHEIPRSALQQVSEAADRAADLTRQLLAFSRRQVLQPVDLDLNDLAANLLKMLRRLIGEHIELDLIPGHRLGSIFADNSQIEQVLVNLCVNARDAMPMGGKLSIETENVVIDAEYCQDHPWAVEGKYVLLSVNDTGCGMDEGTMDQIFDPFFTTKEVGKGTGLGLATVYGIVKQHNGMVQVYSEVDKGTTFKVYLPIVERSASVIGDKIKGPSPSGTETILVAEDEEMVLKLAQRILERAGYTVLTARDGEEAIDIFEKNEGEISLILLDVVMPKIGGHEVQQRILKRNPNVHILFTSGYSQNGVHTNFILEDGLRLIQKPYDRDHLLREIRETLDS